MTTGIEFATGGEPALGSSAKQGEPAGDVTIVTGTAFPSSEANSQGQGAAGVRAPEAPDPAALPCLVSEQVNKSTRPLRGALAGRHRKLIVTLEVQGLVMRYGIGRLGFLTFTFSDDVQTSAEASRRMNSLLSNRLSKRYAEWLAVVQRHKDGKIHFHLVVVLEEDIRRGFNFDQVRNRDYSSASPYLKAEWKWLRETLPSYHFGRHELMPIREEAGFGKYLARYVAGNCKRQAGDVRSRLVRYSRSFQRCVCGPFSPWNFITKRAQKRKVELGKEFPDLVDLVECPWRREAREWLPWLLWSAPDVYFDVVVSRVRDDAELYRGTAFQFSDRVTLYRTAWQTTLEHARRGRW
ncbi:MAG TPA: hypothetical protein VHD32_01295 [Candidatus Didemnitutus sp.]|nr:hypothetical protein [Candidatus Didemnitutus sp.]